MKIRILLADDHALVRAGIRMIIQGLPGFRVIAETGDGQEAVRLARQLEPDIALLDLSMPGLDGPRVARHLRETSSNTRILVHTAQEDKGYLRQALELGVTGYILKHSAADQLVRAIRSVAQGDVDFDPLVAGKRLAESANKPETDTSADCATRTVAARAVGVPLACAVRKRSI